MQALEKKILPVVCAAVMGLAGCGSSQGTVTTTAAAENTTAAETQAAAETTAAETTAAASESISEGETYVADILGEKITINGKYAVEPECTVDIESAEISDFGDFFAEEYPVAVDTYKLMEGTEYEIEVYHIASENPGPIVYIVGGIHGDERAGWFAGMLLRKVTISKGELYVLSPANAKGAKNLTRYVETADKEDMNRSFPGNPDGNSAEKVAYAIFNDIKEKNPEFLFDLHEAIVYTQGRDFLGSTLIFTDLSKMGDLYTELLWATQDGTICANSYVESGPSPAGSINSEVTLQLGIPTITVETFRGFNIERRVSDQLDIVQYVLQYKGMR